ncbi:hypothetical protein Tco_0619736 [Tanacetum coccineum]
MVCSSYDPSCISTEDPYWMITKRGRRLQRYDLQLIMYGGMFKKILSQGEALKIVSYMGNLQAGGEYEDKDKDFEDIRRSPYNDKDTEDIRRYS